MKDNVKVAVIIIMVTNNINFQFLSAWLNARTSSERGAAMVEYALLLALIAIVAIGAIGLLGRTVSGQFSEINSGLNG